MNLLPKRLQDIFEAQARQVLMFQKQKTSGEPWDTPEKTTNSKIEHVYFMAGHHADESETKSFKRDDGWFSAIDGITALAVKAYDKWWMFEAEVSTHFVFPSGENTHQENLLAHGYENGSNTLNVKIQFFCNPLLLEKQMLKQWQKQWGSHQHFKEGMAQLEREKQIMLEQILTQQAGKPILAVKPKV